MFTQPCVIRKNTKELREKLRRLGYKVPKLTETEGRKYGILCNSKAAIGIPKNGYEFNLDKYLKDFPYIVDCKQNEEVFLALAALRDDTDKNQWFIYDYNDNWEEVGDFSKKGDFVLCKTDYYYFGTDVRKAHKATPQELMEYFRK